MKAPANKKVPFDNVYFVLEDQRTFERENG